MGLHHRRDDGAVTTAVLSIDPARVPAAGLVPHDAPPAGLGYPPPTSYRPHPVTGVPTPPRGTAPVTLPRSAGRSARRPASRIATRAPLTIAVAGAAMALIGAGSQLPALVDAVTTTAASTPVAASPAAPSPAVAQQCASVVADALDGTVAALGRTPSTRWAQVLTSRGDELAATYGDTSREHRAYERGADDILGWLRADSAEDYGTVTTRVARTVAETCGA